jgi:hypothetical protein
MPARRDFTVLRKEVHHRHFSIGAATFLSAAALLGLGAGVFFMLPGESASESPVASAAANAPEPTADESFCDKQAWPYVDQRCAKRVEAARGTRQVRIVTDKGHSVTTVTPLPVVEAKPAPAPAAPAVAQAERPIGPAAAPAAAESSPQAQTIAAAPQPASVPAPQNPSPKAAAAPAPTVQVTVAPANRPAATEAMARENPNPPANGRDAAIPPRAASTEPTAPGVDAFAEGSNKSKSARAAEKAERRALEKAAKREAKRRGKPIDEDNSDVPEDAVTAAKPAPSGGQNSRATRKSVPDEVIAAVEEATAESRGRRGRGVVTIGSPSGGQRIYLVPREGAIPGGLD